MPLYEYECDTCGHRFEKIQKFSDPLESTCPVCGGPVHKLVSSPAIQFKGSGFYITDYRDKSYSDSAKADTAGGSSETKSDAKSETKAEAKSESKSESKSEKKPVEKKAESKPVEPKASKSAEKK